MESIIPLLTSLVVSLGGLYLGWLTYRKVEKGSPDPLARLGFLFNVFKYKYGIDEFYRDVFIRPSVWISEVFTYRWIDKAVLDGIIEGIGKGALWLGRVVRSYIDLPLWNQGMTDGLGMGVRKSGEALRPVQTGRVQMYMVLTLLIVLLASALFYFLMV